MTNDDYDFFQKANIFKASSNSDPCETRFDFG